MSRESITSDIFNSSRSNFFITAIFTTRCLVVCTLLNSIIIFYNNMSLLSFYTHIQGQNQLSRAESKIDHSIHSTELNISNASTNDRTHMPKNPGPVIAQ